MEPLRPEDRLMRAAGSSRRCIGKDVRLRDRGSDAVSVEARAAAARAAVGGGGRAGAKATEADPSDPAKESTGNEAARVRSQPPAPPLGLSAENKVPGRATAPAHRRGVRRSRLPAPLFPLSPPGRVLVRVRGRPRAPFVSFPRDSALAGHVSPPSCGQAHGGGGGCGMSLSAREHAECGAGDLLLVGPRLQRLSCGGGGSGGGRGCLYSVGWVRGGVGSGVVTEE